MRGNYKFLLLAMLIAFASCSFTSKTFDDPDKDKLLIQLITYLLDQGHFDPQEINDDFSANVYEDYLISIDPYKRYFYASDIKEFEAYRNLLDDQIKAYDVSFFNLTHERLLQRIGESKKMYGDILEKPFDFSKNEDYSADYEKLEYVNSKREMKERWRQQLKFSTIANYDDAIVHYNKALDIFNKLDKKIDIANVHVNLGNAYVKLHQVAEANGHYQSALVMYEENGQKRGVATTLANIAFMYDEIKQYDTAMEYHHKALDIRKTISGKEDLARSLLAVGMGYRKLQDFTKAKYYLNKALIRAEEIKAKPLKRDVYKNLASIYAIERNFYKAYETQQLLATMKDSMLNEDSSRQLSELQTKYETAQKDQEITLLTKENEIQQANAEKESTLRSALIGGLFLLGIIAGLIFYTMRTRLKNQKLLELC